MVYGYGVAISDDKITAASTHRILSLLRLAPYYEKDCQEKLYECIDPDAGETIESLSVEEILDILTGGSSSVGPILKEVIQEAEGIDLYYDCDGFDGGSDYLVLLPRMPWNWTTDAEKQLTESTLAKILHKYIAIVSDCSTYRICCHEFN